MDVSKMTIEELKDFYDNFPESSACDRAQKEKLKQYIEIRLSEIENGSN